MSCFNNKYLKTVSTDRKLIHLRCVSFVRCSSYNRFTPQHFVRYIKILVFLFNVGSSNTKRNLKFFVSRSQITVDTRESTSHVTSFMYPWTFNDTCINCHFCTAKHLQMNLTIRIIFKIPGELCEEDFNECDSNPCQNNGTCTDITNGYTCTCPAGYSGVHCEIDVAVCNATNETRCSNGGVCVEGPGVSFECRCKPGMSGVFEEGWR